MCLNTEFNCLVFVSKFVLKFCLSIGGTTYPVNADFPNNNLSTDKTPKHHQKSSKNCLINTLILKLLFPNLLSGFVTQWEASVIPSMQLALTSDILPNDKKIAKSFPKNCFIQYFHLFFSKCHFVQVTFGLIVILSQCHFIEVAFCLRVIWFERPFVLVSFFPNVILCTCHLIKVFCTIVI
jgi:hypothetical protein